MVNRSWGALGGPLVALGRSWDALVRSWVALGSLLGRSWGALGALLEQLRYKFTKNRYLDSNLLVAAGILSGKKGVNHV